MIRYRQSNPRHAATVVECAIVLPVTFFLLFSIIIGAMGIFRYQEAASLARQGARYASTHGYQYRKDAGEPIGTSSDWQTDIYNNGIAPYIVALDSNNITYTITWPDVINQPGKPDNWPGSKVTVQVNYQWMPELYLVGPINLTSTSSMPITN
jgi:hypothetical protein